MSEENTKSEVHYSGDIRKQFFHKNLFQMCAFIHCRIVRGVSGVDSANLHYYSLHRTPRYQMGQQKKLAQEFSPSFQGL